MAGGKETARRGASVGLLLLLVGLLGAPVVGATPVIVGDHGAPAATSVYTETIQAPNLSATETYSFDFDGVTHSAHGGVAVQIHGVAAGTHTISNITASPSSPGWAYFGHSDPSGLVVVPEESTVNLSFSLLDLAEPPVQITFHTVHVLFGTLWSLEFNGTSVSSVTRSIVVTSRPGFVPVQALPAVDLRGTTRYTPPPPEPAFAVNETPSSLQVNLSYTDSFEVQVYASTGGFVQPNGTSWESANQTLTIRATGYPGYQFGRWNGSGINNYSGVAPRENITIGGPLIETGTFWPIGANRDVIRIDQVGIPSGTIWSAYLDGGGFSSATAAVVIPNVYPCGPGTPGLYNLSIPIAYSNATDPVLEERYIVGPYPTTVCGGTILNVTFSNQSLVTFRSSPGGSVAAANGSGAMASGSWADNGSVVGFQATPAPGYLFAGWFSNGSSSVTATQPSLSVTVVGPVEEVAEFVPITGTAIPTYSTTLIAAGALPAGAVWSVRVGGLTLAASTPTLVIPGLPAGSYTVNASAVLSPDGLTELQPVVPSFRLTVPSSTPLEVNFTTWYRVEVEAAPGGSASANVTWASAGAPVVLRAAASSGHSFLGWAGAGDGNYTGSLSSVTIDVNGPVYESATFAPTPVGPRNWNGLIVSVTGGVVLGVLIALFRPRRPRSPAAPSAPPPPPEGRAAP